LLVGNTDNGLEHAFEKSAKVLNWQKDSLLSHPDFSFFDIEKY